MRPEGEHRLQTFYGLMSGPTRRRLLATVVLMPAAIVAEMLTVGATLALLAFAAQRDAALIPAWAREWFSITGVDPLVGAAVGLAVAALAAMAVRLTLLWISQGFVSRFGHELASAIFSRMLRQPYEAYLQRNSSEVLSAMEKVQRLIFGVLQPAMQGAIAAVLAVFIAALLFAIDPLAASVGALAVALAYAVIAWSTRQRLRLNSGVLADTITQRTRTIQEGLGGIRDIILDQSYPVFEQRFRDIDERYRRAAATNVFIVSSPRYVVEGTVIVAVAVLVMTSARYGDLIDALPVLGALAIGAQRLLPLVQQAWTGWSMVTGNRRLFHDLAAFLTAPVASEEPAAPPMPCREAIVFEGVSFDYRDRQFSLKDLSLTIASGERIGIAGPTGAGKSTFLDLLMGLLEPDSGTVLIDGVAVDRMTRPNWRAAIAHVPQAIFLADDTIAANIAFASATPIEPGKLAIAAEAARLDGFIAGLPDGYETRVGERGMRLSGGQRQRIGIARALYRDASLLILDEATNALDEATEAEVLQSIAALPRNLTIVMATHRQAALASCDRVLRFDKGMLVAA